jgi:hypothetical protein
MRKVDNALSWPEKWNCANLVTRIKTMIPFSVVTSFHLLFPQCFLHTHRPVLGTSNRVRSNRTFTNSGFIPRIKYYRRLLGGAGGWDGIWFPLTAVEQGSRMHKEALVQVSFNSMLDLNGASEMDRSKWSSI